MYACLAVTCHLHFWQNDRDFLRATAVTRGWNGYRNKSQHRKSTLEKKILPPFQQGFEPATFQSRVRCSNHWAIPAPLRKCCWSYLYIRAGRGQRAAACRAGPSCLLPAGWRRGSCSLVPGHACIAAVPRPPATGPPEHLAPQRTTRSDEDEKLWGGKCRWMNLKFSWF